MVWMEMPVARGTVDGPARRSTTSTRAPWRSAESAVARPAGPAPTMSTSVVNMPPRSRADRLGTSVSATYLDARPVRAPTSRSTVVKSIANTFFVTATATPRSGSAPAQLPPAPAQPNARGAPSSNGRPSAKPRLMRHSLPYTWSSPSADTVVTSASRGLVSHDAYSAAIARAVTLAPAGMSAAIIRGSAPSAAVGKTVSGAARSIGESAGTCDQSTSDGASSGTASPVASRHAVADLAGVAELGGEVGEDVAQLAPGDPPHDLAREVAERVGVVADLRARLPPRLRVLQCGDHRRPRADVVDRDARGQPRHPRGVVEHLPHGDDVLAVLAELRPHLDDAGLRVEAQPVHQRGRRALPDRPVVEQRVGRDGSPGGRVRHPRDDVDDLLPVHVGGHLQPALRARRHQLVGDLLDSLIPGSTRRTGRTHRRRR